VWCSAICTDTLFGSTCWFHFKGIQIRWRQVTPHRQYIIPGCKAWSRREEVNLHENIESRTAMNLLFYRIGERPEQLLKADWASWMWHKSFSSCHKLWKWRGGGGRQRETEKTKERQRQTRSQLLHLRKIAPSILTCQLWAVSLHSKFPSPYKLPLTWQWHWRWQWQCQWQWQWQWQCQWQWHATTCVSCFRPITTEIHRGSGHSSFFHRKYRHPATAVVVGGAINWTFCFVCTSQTGYCHNCGVRHQLQLLTAGLWCYRKKTNCHGCWYAVRNMFKAVNICDKSMFGDRTFRALFRRTPTVLHSQAMAQLRQIVSFITRGWVPFCFSGMRRTVLQAFNICFASQKGLYLIKIYFPFIVCVLLV